MIDFNALLKAFPASAVSWRAQTLKSDGSAAMALCYIDARDVMRRLDEVCGPGGWQDSYHETARGRLICTISIRCGDEWIAKSDGAGDTDVEGEKGAISDAFKRAAVKWGVGRYLYDMDPVWAECETYERNGKKQWKAWTVKGRAKLNTAAANSVAHVVPADQGSVIKEIERLAGEAGMSIQTIVEGWSLSALAELTSDQASKTIARLKEIIAASKREAA